MADYAFAHAGLEQPFYSYDVPPAGDPDPHSTPSLDRKLSRRRQRRWEGSYPENTNPKNLTTLTRTSMETNGNPYLDEISIGRRSNELDITRQEEQLKHIFQQQQQQQARRNNGIHNSISDINAIDDGLTDLEQSWIRSNSYASLPYSDGVTRRGMSNSLSMPVRPINQYVDVDIYQFVVFRYFIDYIDLDNLFQLTWKFDKAQLSLTALSRSHLLL